MKVGYNDYMRTWRAGHFENEPLLSAQEWFMMSPDAQRVTINVLQHQQRLIRDAAAANAQPKGDIPKTVLEGAWGS